MKQIFKQFINKDNEKVASLCGQSMSGKTLLLKVCADKAGYLYKEFDCLEYLNALKVEELFAKISKI